jgi:hypothetical protein
MSFCPRLMAAALPRGMAVHRAHFAVDLVIAVRLLQYGIRICLSSLFCVCAARKQRPGCNENHKQADKHLLMSTSETVSQAIHPMSNL